MGSRPRFIDDLSRAASDAPGPNHLNSLSDDALLDAYSRTVIGALERVQQAVAFISVERRLAGTATRERGFRAPEAAGAESRLFNPTH